MTGKTKHPFALTPAFRQQGGRRLQPGKPLPRRLAQLAYDLHGQCLHIRNVCQSRLNVKRTYAWLSPSEIFPANYADDREFKQTR